MGNDVFETLRGVGNLVCENFHVTSMLRVYPILLLRGRVTIYVMVYGGSVAISHFSVLGLCLTECQETTSSVNSVVGRGALVVAEPLSSAQPGTNRVRGSGGGGRWLFREFKFGGVQGPCGSEVCFPVSTCP